MNEGNCIIGFSLMFHMVSDMLQYNREALTRVLI